MNKKLTAALAIAIFILSSTAFLAPANAAKQPYDLTGAWVFNDIYGTTFVHVMMINSFDPHTGAFSGTGYYTGDKTLTWTISGTENGNTVNYVLTVQTPAADYGITLTGTGTLTSGTSMSGTGCQTNIPGPCPNVQWSATKDQVQVLNIVYHVINDEDSGFKGYWALDHYDKHVQVWQTGTNTYAAIITYDGGWHTFAGALSPQNGATESRDAAGNYDGFLDFTFTADSNTPFTGNLPTKNYGGTMADILLGRYGNGQTGPANVFSWTSVYFTNFGNEVDSGWAFYYYMGNNLSWVNAAFCTASGGSVDCNSVYAPNDIAV